ncbi:hypothetical protein EXIGLDRAFT_731694 [Exidia glandulosa HHB12029]|uniref:Uncharacterized protein n=1 Tax=Exidia glandulosa HHB12029 TaxID=1314781 RepID=A0A165BS16_EXIGL|nr:hypothetical protein EXIGLDRAFT_731694 [Exidia glandulosa HHB12029]
MFSNDSRLRHAIAALSAAAAASASHSPTSPMTPLGAGLIPQSEPPTADYMGDEILFVLPSLQHFETWKKSVETTLVVDFHPSRSTPKAFLEQVKLVCARHSRSGRKPYTKKHPDRQRKVPSRKVPNGCPATISYRTFEDKPEVHVSYVPQHAHATGAANYEFTREGRRAAAAAGSKSRSPLVETYSEFEDYMTPYETPSMHPDGNTYSYSNAVTPPTSARMHSRPLPIVTSSPGLSLQDDGQPHSPISPMQPGIGLPTSPTGPFGWPSEPYLPVSAAVSPARTAQSLPTPMFTTTALPTSTPVHTSQALPHSTPGMGTHALPMSTPNHHTHTLPNTPAFNTQPLGSPMSGTHGLPPHMLSSPMHAPHNITASPMHSTHSMPQSSYTTPMLNITTQLPGTYDSTDPFAILGTMSDSSEQDYGPFSAVSADNSGNSLTVPGAGEQISLTITSSPSPHMAALGVEGLYPYAAQPQQTEMHDPAQLGTYDDLRADHWRRMQRLFEAVHSHHSSVPFSNEALYQLQGALEQLWREAEAHGERNASTESLVDQFLSG